MTTVTRVRPQKTAEQLAADMAKRQQAAAAAAANAWVGASNSEFVAATLKRAHKGRFSLTASNGGYQINASVDGKTFFANRKASVNRLNGEMINALLASKANKGGKYASREFFPNAAKIGGKAISLPVFAGAGDALQQHLFASLIINEI